MKPSDLDIAKNLQWIEEVKMWNKLDHVLPGWNVINSHIDSTAAQTEGKNHYQDLFLLLF